MDATSMAAACKALSHPARVRIVRLLSGQAECRGADLFAGLPLAQSTVSEHLRILREAGLVRSRSEGPGMVYCLVPGLLESLGDTISRIGTESVANGAARGRCE